MDDLSCESLAARVATLPFPEVQRRIARREQQHAAFIRRADAWARARAGGGPVVVEYPRDQAVVVALGVPCDDCLELVYADGVGGHRVRFGAASGEHWAALISARCGRYGAGL